MKKVYFCILTVILSIACLLQTSVVALAENIPDYSGTTQYNGMTVKSWTLNANSGVLNIFDRGDGHTGDSEDWQKYAAFIKIVNIESGIKYISGFDGCSRLAEVNIPHSVTSMGVGCFSGCSSLKNIILPLGLEYIPWNAFGGCSSLTSITIPDSVKEIHGFAFSGCTNLREINLSNTLESIGDSAFEDCINLSRVVFPMSLKTIETGAFCACKNLVEVKLNTGLESIESDVFKNCTSLEKLYMPDTVVELGDEALSGCSNLRSLHYSYGLLSIPQLLLFGCNNLSDVYFSGTVAEWSSICTSKYGCVEGNCVIDYATLHCKDAVVYGESKESRIYSIRGTEHNGLKISCDAFYKADYIVINYSKNPDFPENFTQTVRTNVNASNSYTVSNEWNLNNHFLGNLYFRIRYERQIYDNNYYYSEWSNTVCVPVSFENGVLSVGCNHSVKTIVTSKATTKKDGQIYKKCSVCGAVTGKTVIAKASNIKLSQTAYTYNGKVQKPSVTVKDSKGKALKSTDYKIDYPKGMKNVGKYTVKVTLKGNYSGSKSMTYNINPKGTSVSKVTAAKKGFKVTWKKQTTQTTGYQVQYSTSSKFKSAKTVTISKNKTTSKSVSKLSAKKKYYVRVRTYKTVKVNGKNVKLYSGWSKAKSVTTKK